MAEDASVGQPCGSRDRLVAGRSLIRAKAIPPREMFRKLL